MGLYDPVKIAQPGFALPRVDPAGAANSIVVNYGFPPALAGRGDRQSMLLGIEMKVVNATAANDVTATFSTLRADDDGDTITRGSSLDIGNFGGDSFLSIIGTAPSNIETSELFTITLQNGIPRFFEFPSGMKFRWFLDDNSLVPYFRVAYSSGDAAFLSALDSTLFFNELTT